MKRPKIKDFFPEGSGVADAHKEYIRSPNLYRYMNALDAYADHLESLSSSDQKPEVSDTTGDASSTSAGNQTPSTETPPSSTKEEKDLVIETSMESVVKFETEVERLKKEVKIYYKGFTDMASALLIAKKALEKIEKTVESGNLKTRRIAREALSQINKGEPGK